MSYQKTDREIESPQQISPALDLCLSYQFIGEHSKNQGSLSGTPKQENHQNPQCCILKLWP